MRRLLSEHTCRCGCLQCPSGPADAALDGWDSHTLVFRDLCIGEITQLPENEGYPEVLGNGFQRLLDKVRSCELLSEITFSCKVFRDFKFRVPSGSHDSQCRVGSYPVDPGAEPGFASESADISPRCKESVLEGILGVVSISCNPQAHRPDHCPVLTRQLLKCAGIAGSCRFDKARLGQDRVHRSPCRNLVGRRKTKHETCTATIGPLNTINHPCTGGNHREPRYIA